MSATGPPAAPMPDSSEASDTYPVAHCRESTATFLDDHPAHPAPPPAAAGVKGPTPVQLDADALAGGTGGGIVYACGPADAEGAADGVAIEAGDAPLDPDDPQALPEAARRRVLALFFLLKILTSYDGGAYSAVLGIDEGIADDLGLGVVDEGALGSAPFIGNTIGCAVAGVVLSSSVGAKTSLVCSMALHTVATLVLASAPNFTVALLGRIVIGFTLSFVVVYSIVWTDTFAPPQRTTLWMALMNVGVPFGMLLGFISGGAVVPMLDLSWRFAFVFKAAVMLPVICLLATRDPRYIEEPESAAGSSSDDSPGSSGSPDGPVKGAGPGAPGAFTPPPGVLGIVSGAFHKTVWLFSNGLFAAAVASLTILYFVITALQVFITPFLRAPPFEASMNTIVFVFGVAAVTAPVAGAISGGLLLDKLGGYQQNLHGAAIFGACCALMAAWCGFAACFMDTTMSFIGTLWLTLFFGAANVPAMTGIMMAAVPPSLRSTASSYANIAFNILGYFMGPLLCGYLAEAVGSLHSAVHVILMLSVLGSIPSGIAVHLAARRVLAGSAAGSPAGGSSVGGDSAGVSAGQSVVEAPPGVDSGPPEAPRRGTAMNAPPTPGGLPPRHPELQANPSVRGAQQRG